MGIVYLLLDSHALHFFLLASLMYNMFFFFLKIGEILKKIWGKKARFVGLMMS